MKRIGLVLFLGLFISQAFAQDAMKIAGIWWNDKKTSKIEVKEENGKFIGTVIFNLHKMIRVFSSQSFPPWGELPVPIGTYREEGGFVYPET
jgi:hypothetical protein